MDISIFDLDGVIADISERLRRILEAFGKKKPEELSRVEKEKFWEKFLSSEMLQLDKPITETIDYMRKLKEKGVTIVIITGRREDMQKDETLKQLKSWGVPYDKIYFRRKSDVRRDFIFKKSIIEGLRREGYNIIEIWDDSEKVIEEVRKIIPEAKIVKFNRY
ncbi:MAG: HAD family acid phosphatase [Candidatus Methanomethylicia archaeon]